MNEASVIRLKIEGSYFDQKFCIHNYSRWLTDRGIYFTFMPSETIGIPYIVVMDAEDAVAFKLRFGL